MIRRPLSARGVVLLLAGVTAGAALTGCSADGAVRGTLSQAAGIAAASARSAGLVLGLQQNDRMLGTVLGTGLTASADTLAEQARTVSTLTAVGEMGSARNEVLSDIRSAQDAVAAAERAVAAGQEDPAAFEGPRRELDSTAAQLDAASQRLER